MATVHDVETLGYTVGLATGSVDVEEQALASAQTAADPNVVAEQANTVTNDTMQTLDNIGKLPETPEERLELATRIAEQALSLLTENVSERVAFHERAVEIAKTMPNTWHVSGPGLEVYVDCKEDGTGWNDESQAMLDALADPDAHAERVYQAENPKAMQAAQEITSAGVEIARPTPGADAWEAEGRTFTAADLPTFLEEVQARPPLPTTAERVAEVISAAPEFSDATKHALVAALEQPKP